MNVNYSDSNIIAQAIVDISQTLIRLAPVAGHNLVVRQKKYLFNQTKIVSQAIDGNLTLSSDLVRVQGHNIVARCDYESYKSTKVAILSGGGSGHEPLHGGFVGQGMLTGAVCGEIFASPSVKAILTAILLLTGDKGCLLIVKNYTGDRLNFGLAAEQARAMGKNVEILLVADDIANENPEKRRGIAGVVFIHKIAGYLAEKGCSLEEIKDKCQQAAAGLISLGLAISGADSLSDTEIIEFEPQLGRGIHNEAGEKFTFNTEDIAFEAVEKLTERLAPKLDNSYQYMLMINNLGGLSQLEMSLITDQVLKSSLEEHIKYVVGPKTFCTSLNMSGFSLSLLALRDDEIEEALLGRVSPRAWVQPVSPVVPQLIDVSHLNVRHQYTPSNNPSYREIIESICDVLITSKDKLNDLDSHGGDGDSGETLALAATSIAEEIPNLPLADLGCLLSYIGEILSDRVGGSSGVLFSLLFTHAGIALQHHEAETLPNALSEGVEVMMRYAGSSQGDRSILDALVPALSVLEDTGNLELAANAARTGADNTARMIANVGRAANVSPTVYLGFNDSGAEAIALIFERLATDCLSNL